MLFEQCYISTNLNHYHILTQMKYINHKIRWCVCRSIKNNLDRNSTHCILELYIEMLTITKVPDYYVLLGQENSKFNL